MRKRTRARELCLKILYQVDLRGPGILDDLDGLLVREEFPESVMEYARGMVLGAVEIREEADRHIAAAAEHWDISRMAVIDRNVLRLAFFEMTRRPDVPVKVCINEAIELAKRYSTGQSGAFINGILDRIRKNLEEEREQA